MIAMWILCLRVAVAACFLTVAVVANETARDLAFPYAALVLLVVVIDLVRWRHA